MKQIKRAELLATVSGSSKLPAEDSQNVFIKKALRRAAFQLAPCSFTDIVRFVHRPLSSLDISREVVEEILEALITFGDILEMRRIDSDPWDAPELVLRPAPPSFVIRENGDAIIIGLSGELASPLPEELNAALDEVGPVRILRADVDDLKAQLESLGLLYLKEAAWLRSPNPVEYDAYLHKWRAELSNAEHLIEQIEGVEILDTAKSNAFYRGRWVTPTIRHTGTYIARRPQRYGANIWSLVDISQGKPVHLLDIPKSESHRQCDTAWRVQAALDAESGVPQQFKVTSETFITHLDFLSPLPAFAERRLSLCGQKLNTPNCLYRYSVPNKYSEIEINQLRTTMWLEPKRERGQ